jgi:outer membrane lipoprotein-sorting protein
MSVFASRPTLRWVLPAAALAGVIVAGSAGRMLVQDTSNALPERTPQQLLMDVAQAKVSSLSGTIVQKSDLGLPSLPQLSGTDLNTLVNGNHTVRFWYDGDKRVRVAAQNPDSSESDLVRNGTNLWTYSSASKTATHTTLPASTGATPGGPSGGMPSVMPSAGAGELSGGISQFLTTLAPTTKISTDGTAKVAGRQAYELVIQPKDTNTRIAQIRIAIDGTKHIPLQFQVYARGSNDPAFSAGFTNISFSKPDAAEFTFNPPAGTKVTQAKPDQNKSHQAKPDQKKPSQANGNDTQVVGKGWTSVIVAENVPTSVPAGKTADQKQAAAATDKFLKSLPKVHGAWGSGRLIQTKLFSVLLTDDGRLIAGAVNPGQLYQAAEQTK